VTLEDTVTAHDKQILGLQQLLQHGPLASGSGEAVDQGYQDNVMAPNNSIAAQAAARAYFQAHRAEA
jgi:hypothetical protein